MNNLPSFSDPGFRGEHIAAPILNQSQKYIAIGGWVLGGGLETSTLLHSLRSDLATHYTLP